jgi:hypothetical protein
MKLDSISKNQDNLEMKFNAQNDKINEIFSNFKYDVDKERGKGKEKKSRNEFYQVNIASLFLFCLFRLSTLIILQDAIRKLSHELFHEHKSLTDEDFKLRLTAKLDGDEYCANQLRRMQDNGVSYNELWEEKLYSAVSIFFFFYVFSCYILYCIYFN